jgi:hypothetical protein
MVWRQLHRDGITVARCTVERLMGEPGLEGDRGSQYLAIRYTHERLAESGGGHLGRFSWRHYDNALAETLIGAVQGRARGTGSSNRASDEPGAVKELRGIG